MSPAVRSLERATRTITAEHAQHIREAMRKKRQEDSYSIDVIASDKPKDTKYLDSLDKRLNDYFTTLNVILFKRQEPVAFSTAMLFLKHTGCEINQNQLPDIMLFITTYCKNALAVNEAQPFTKSSTLIGSNGWLRREAINDLKKEAIENLKLILKENVN